MQDVAFKFFGLESAVTAESKSLHYEVKVFFVLCFMTINTRAQELHITVQAHVSRNG
jgi:lauroyl/myristoyl acyltransferase